MFARVADVDQSTISSTKWFISHSTDPRSARDSSCIIKKNRFDSCAYFVMSCQFEWPTAYMRRAIHQSRVRLFFCWSSWHEPHVFAMHEVFLFFQTIRNCHFSKDTRKTRSSFVQYQNAIKIAFRSGFWFADHGFCISVLSELWTEAISFRHKCCSLPASHLKPFGVN